MFDQTLDSTLGLRLNADKGLEGAMPRRERGSGAGSEGARASERARREWGGGGQWSSATFAAAPLPLCSPPARIWPPSRTTQPSLSGIPELNLRKEKEKGQSGYGVGWSERVEETEMRGKRWRQSG
eukprot:3184791-Rhodomonas_salina.1